MVPLRAVQLLGLKENAFGEVYNNRQRKLLLHTDIITDEVIAAGKEAAEDHFR